MVTSSARNGFIKMTFFNFQKYFSDVADEIEFSTEKFIEELNKLKLSS